MRSAPSAGMTCIAARKPWARKGSSAPCVAAVTPAAAAARAVKKSLARPVPYGPSDAPSTYIAKK